MVMGKRNLHQGKPVRNGSWTGIYFTPQDIGGQGGESGCAHGLGLQGLVVRVHGWVTEGGWGGCGGGGGGGGGGW